MNISRRVPLFTLLCGMAGAAAVAAAGTASAGTMDDSDAHTIAVHYKEQSLDTDRGARAVYQRIVHAADEVCPQGTDSWHFVSETVKQCREQAVAHAVFKINSPKLVAVYNANAGNG